MRRGYTLIEMITVVGILALIAVPLAMLEGETLHNIPRAHTMMQTHITLHNFLRLFQEDINAAVSFPETFGDCNNAEQTIIIELANKTICYQYEEDRLQRLAYSKEKNGEPQARIWKIPYGTVIWSLRHKDDKVYAVEVTTHIRRKSFENSENKLADSYLYFVGLYPEQEQ